MNRTLLAVLAAAVLAGCPKRIEYGPEGPIADPEALLKLIDKTEAHILTVSGDSHVKAQTPEQTGAFSMWVSVARPALLHLEPMDFFGKPQAVLSVNGERFGLYNAQENKFYQGPASPQNVSRFLPIVVPAPELAQIMLGGAPRIPHESAELRVDEGCACYVLTLRRAGGITQTLKVHPTQYRVVESRIEGAKAYGLEFGDLKPWGRIAFPRKMVLEAKDSGVRLELQYTRIDINEAPDLTLFEVAPPEDVPVVEVDEAGAPAAGEGFAPEGTAR